MPAQVHARQVAADSDPTSDVATSGQASLGRALPELTVTCSITEGETVYDAAWYPFANVTDAATRCFVTTARATPVHLWDSEDGRVSDIQALCCSAICNLSFPVVSRGSGCIQPVAVLFDFNAQFGR